jgi:hypothetical protein
MNSLFIVMDYQNLWSNIIIGENKSWVVFKHNTCVILMDPEKNLGKQAINLLKEHGPYHVGTASADMNVIKLESFPGWVVIGNHPDILNYVSEEDIGTDDDNNVAIGILGRHNRAKDAKQLKIVYIEDNR